MGLLYHGFIVAMKDILKLKVQERKLWPKKLVRNPMRVTYPNCLKKSEPISEILPRLTATDGYNSPNQGW